MRRADRLFQIVQILRRDRVTTGAKLAAELGISPRSLYRDVADLMASGVPIESEAGVGYRLPRHFELPPLMFTVDEVEALVAGARMVEAWADPGLREAARSLVRKAEAVLPSRARLEDLPIVVPDFHIPSGAAAFLGDLRAAMRERRKVRFRYARKDGESSVRVVWPLGLAFWGSGWSLAAWCELRNDFRTFRPDRIEGLEALEETFEPVEGRGFDDYLRRQEAN
ncbi:MAG: YafY family transcriptional regulator [Acidobacteria bacterium]|nr:YafY family transcriptional regulator [Acidobacteriota bacterium]